MEICRDVITGSEDDYLSINWTRRLRSARWWPGWLRVCHAEGS
jgi:hypothetical protein